jgi:hypothetical protein
MGVRRGCVVVVVVVVVVVMHGAHALRGWALGDRRRTLLRDARAFGPGGRWFGGVPLQPMSLPSLKSHGILIQINF